MFIWKFCEKFSLRRKILYWYWSLLCSRYILTDYKSKIFHSNFQHWFCFFSMDYSKYFSKISFTVKKSNQKSKNRKYSLAFLLKFIVLIFLHRSLISFWKLFYLVFGFYNLPEANKNVVKHFKHLQKICLNHDTAF